MIYIILIFLTIILLINSAFLYILLKKQDEIINTLKTITNKLLETKIISTNQKDSIPIEEISKDKEKKAIVNTINTSKIAKEHLELNEYIMNDREEILKRNNSHKYLKEISALLDNQPKEKNKELTEYEKNEENNAIISYKELLNNKNKSKKEETKDFIEQLKKLRNNLK